MNSVCNFVKFEISTKQKYNEKKQLTVKVFSI